MNKSILIAAVIGLAILSSPKSYAQTSEKTDSTEVTAERMADLIIREAKKYIGARYRYGSSGSRGFDCSGFTSTIYRKFGYTLARSSKGQATDGRAVEGPLSNLQKGDIVVFGARRKSRTVGHVGIFIELDSTGTDFKFIHASTSSGVTISRMKEPYYDGRFLGARRIIPDFIPSDTTGKGYGFDMDNTVARPDTLQLKENEMRIVLLDGGKWACVSDDGTITKPEGNDRIVLDQATGNWSVVKTSTKQLPSLFASSTQTTATTQTATAAQTQTGDGSPLYHTIKSGDSLYAIAKRYHTTVKAICSLNGMTEKSVLRIGKKIRVK